MKRIGKLTDKRFEGGEAEIYRLQPNILAKIFKPAVNLHAKKVKLEYLMGISLPTNASKPIELLIDNAGDFIGYTMQEIIGTPLSQLSNRKFILANSTTKKEAAILLVGLKQTLQNIHKFCCIGDLSDDNVLFNGNQIFLIDVDSWHLPQYPCKAKHPLFGDPNSTNFSTQTDCYAYNVIAFKALTRLHPFGGVLGDMDILERIKQRISIFNGQVIIPPTIDKWDFLPPQLIEEFHHAFEGDKRDFVNVDEFLNHIAWCDKHQDYYYAGYKQCPVCYAKIFVPVSVGVDDVQAREITQNENIKLIFDLNCWLMKNNTVYFPPLNRLSPFDNQCRYYQWKTMVIIDHADFFTIDDARFDKLHGSRIIPHETDIYYLTKSCELKRLFQSSGAWVEQKVSDCSFRNVYSVYDAKHFFICNIYDQVKMLNIDSYMFKLNHDTQITDYGIHFDHQLEYWLFIFSNVNGLTTTMVFNQRKLLYQSYDVPYNGNPGNVTIDNATIYIPGDGQITGFNYVKNQFKTFRAHVVNQDSKLLKKKDTIIVINDNKIWQLSYTTQTHKES